MLDILWVHDAVQLVVELESGDVAVRALCYIEWIFKVIKQGV